MGIIIIAFILMGSIVFLIYAVALAIGHKNITVASAWHYWETHKNKSWAELSEEEKEKMVVVNIIIANDVGAVATKDQLIEMLEEQLPISEPHVGLSYKSEL